MNYNLKAIEAFDQLLSSPEKWTKGAGARDALGYVCSSNGNRATSLCLLGAANRVAVSMPSYEDAYCDLCELLRMAANCDGVDSVVRFNDASTTSFDDIRAVIAKMRVMAGLPVVEQVKQEKVLEDV